MWKCGQGDKGYITSTQLFIHFCVYIINGFVNNSINLNEIMLLFNTINQTNLYLYLIFTEKLIFTSWLQNLINF
jgi:hypothetical protein